MSRLELDMFGGVETRLQWDIVSESKCISKQLGLHDGSKCRTSYNVHKQFSWCQQGGTFIAATETAGSFVTASGADTEDLGRWSWMKLVGETITTRVIIAYQPCITHESDVQATMDQQRRYWRLQENRQCSRKLFCQHLVEQLTEWRNDNEKFILLLDDNGNMTSEPLSRLLQGPDISMVDAIQLRSQNPSPHTCVRGSRQIDGAWVTPDINITAACFLPFTLGLVTIKLFFLIYLSTAY